jgi:diguanylate cyclase (GGDEF)-like protein
MQYLVEGSEKMQRLLFIVMLYALLFIVAPIQTKAETIPTYDSLENAQSIEQLDGNWLYFNKKLTDGMTTGGITTGEIVQLPVQFKELLHNSEGYGTFVKRIMIPEQYIGDILAIRSPYEYGASKVFVNGKEIIASGRVGTSIMDHKTIIESKIGYFKVEKEANVIAVQFSTFGESRSGFANPIIIGEANEITKEEKMQSLLLVFSIGIIAIIGILTIFMGMTRKDGSSFFAFGLFCLFVIIRTVVTVPVLYRDLSFVLTYEVAMKIEYISTALMVLFFVLYVYHLYRDIFSIKNVRVNVSVLILVSFIVLLTTPKFYQEVFFVLCIFEVFMLSYMFYVFYVAFRTRMGFALSNFIGVVVSIAGMGIDFLSSIGIINLPPVSHYASTMHVIILVVSMASAYSKQYDETEVLTKRLMNLNSSLDQLVKQRTAELSYANSKYQKLASQDGLTKLFNRHHFDAELEKQFTNGIRPSSLIMFDLDEFKKYNDYYGHVLGDEILIRVVEKVRPILPPDATFARYGGEEFVILLPNMPKAKAERFALVICTEISNANFEHLGRENKKVTISVGGATLEKKTEFKSAKHWLDVTDQQLYLSKANGRNQVTYY